MYFVSLHACLPEQEHAPSPITVSIVGPSCPFPSLRLHSLTTQPGSHRRGEPDSSCGSIKGFSSFKAHPSLPAVSSVLLCSCCSCTCVTAPGDDDNGCRDGFQCIDPAAECVDDDDITVDQVENCGYVAGIGEWAIPLTRAQLA